MATTETVKGLLLRSSINLKAINESTRSFSEGMTKARLSTQKIASSLEESNRIKKKMIASDDTWFRKRRNAVKRKENEDLMEAGSIGGAVKRTGNALADSTKGFLGRIMDFVGVIMVGWLASNLPRIIKGAQELMKKIQGVVDITTGWFNFVVSIFTGLGSTLEQQQDSVTNSNLTLQKESGAVEKELNNVRRGVNVMEMEILDGFNQYNAAVDEENKKRGKKDENKDGAEGQQNQWWDFLDLFPNKEKEQEVETDQESDENQVESEQESDNIQVDSDKDKVANLKTQQNNKENDRGPDVRGLDGEELSPEIEAEQEDALEQSGFEMYEEGTSRVPKDGLAYLHKDEAVIPKKSVDKLGPEFITKMIQGNVDTTSGKLQEAGSLMKKLVAEQSEQMKGVDGIFDDMQASIDKLKKKKKEDKGNRGFLGLRSAVDFMTGGLTDLDKKGNEFNLINPKNKKEKIQKLKTPRKGSKVIMLNNESSNSSPVGGQPSLSKPSGGIRRLSSDTSSFYRKIASASIYAYT
tara:strand:- start:1902 stop:3470 length:1569 start_codon:yes stop_codon:yes gene_type:complete